MEDNTTIEKKLQLVKQIRSQYNQNQCDLSNREQILYGRISCKTSLGSQNDSFHKIVRHGETTAINDAEDTTVSASESLKLRSVLAAILFLFAILFDLFGVQPAGVKMQQVFEVIAADYQENMTAFVDAVTEENILSR